MSWRWQSNLQSISAIVALLLLATTEAMYWDRSFTPVIPQNKIECYYVPGIKFRQDVQMDFQVVRGSDGKSFRRGMTVNFEVYDPDNMVIQSFTDSETNSYNFNAARSGDYKVCLYSYSGQKSVFVEVSVHDTKPEQVGEGDTTGGDDDVYDYMYEEDEYFQQTDMEEMKRRDREEVQKQFDTTVKVIKSSLQEIRQNLHKSAMAQGFLMSTLTKDMFLMLSNQSRVNFWSLIYIGVLVATGLTQVFVIRRLFDEKSPQKLRVTT